METSLHRQLKNHYAAAGGLTEQRVGRYRIDVILDKQLVEIQLAPLSAIRDKIAALLKKHEVLVVKPVIARKHLVKRRRGVDASFPAAAARSNARYWMCSKSWSTLRAFTRTVV